MIDSTTHRPRVPGPLSRRCIHPFLLRPVRSCHIRTSLVRVDIPPLKWALIYSTEPHPAPSDWDLLVVIRTCRVLRFATVQMASLRSLVSTAVLAQAAVARIIPRALDIPADLPANWTYVGCYM